MPFCPRCGARLDEGAGYCLECGAPVTPLDRVASFPRSGADRLRPVGFYYLVASGIIIGTLAACIVIGLTLTANWVADALRRPAPVGATVTLFGAIAFVAFLVWLVHETLQRR